MANQIKQSSTSSSVKSKGVSKSSSGTAAVATKSSASKSTSVKSKSASRNQGTSNALGNKNVTNGSKDTKHNALFEHVEQNSVGERFSRLNKKIKQHPVLFSFSLIFPIGIVMWFMLNAKQKDKSMVALTGVIYGVLIVFLIGFIVGVL